MIDLVYSELAELPGIGWNVFGRSFLKVVILAKGCLNGAKVLGFKNVGWKVSMLH